MGTIQDTSLYQKLRYRARATKYARKVDPFEIRFVRKLLKPGDLAIDVGAHKGGYVYWLQKAVTASGKVLAFEPQQELAEYLNYVVDTFGFSQVEVVGCAVSDVAGSRSLFSPGSRASTGATLVEDLFPENDSVEQVDAVTLDDYLSTRTDLQAPRYIKIDVETHELEVVKGSRGTLRAVKPVVQLEADQHVYGDRSIFDIFELLTSMEFSGYFFFNKKLRSLENFDLPTHQPAVRRHTPNHPGFANNFLFLSSEKEGRILRQYGIASV